ncbi:transferase [Usnea florida]
MSEKAPIHKHADPDGQFPRKPSQFRSTISSSPSSPFPPEKDRYALYLNLGCPWAHRTNLVRSLKGLDSIIQLIVCDFELTKEGWLFTGRNGSDAKDPLYGFTRIQDLYKKADSEYEGRFTVPVLWDKKAETVVNNESAEIMRMFYEEFDVFLPGHLREAGRPGGGFYPERLRAQIDEMNEWVYDTVNNGVYKTGFATTQEAYEASLYPLFDSLDRLEGHLGEPGHQPYLFGEHVTEADVRLYTTLIRFDVAYYNIFMCNLKMIRYDYPRLSRWLRNLYWDGGKMVNGHAFKDTVDFWTYKYGYLRAKGRAEVDERLVIPKGPVPDIPPLDDDHDHLTNGH